MHEVNLHLAMHPGSRWAAGGGPLPNARLPGKLDLPGAILGKTRRNSRLGLPNEVCRPAWSTLKSLPAAAAAPVLRTGSMQSIGYQEVYRPLPRD